VIAAARPCAAPQFHTSAELLKGPLPPVPRSWSCRPLSQAAGPSRALRSRARSRRPPDSNFILARSAGLAGRRKLLLCHDMQVLAPASRAFSRPLKFATGRLRQRRRAAGLPAARTPWTWCHLHSQFTIFSASKGGQGTLSDTQQMSTYSCELPVAPSRVAPLILSFPQLLLPPHHHHSAALLDNMLSRKRHGSSRHRHF
jgi:hypothetical protein